MNGRVAIGTRYTPQHVVRLDSQSGFFEEVNASRQSLDAARLQLALLVQPRPAQRARQFLRGALFFGAMAAVGVILAWRG